LQLADCWNAALGLDREPNRARRIKAHRRKGINASIDSWLVKPVGIKQLKDEVEKMIVKDEEDE
jgi:hypothetical protein